MSWRITINPDRRSSTWWDNARASPHAPQPIVPMLEVFGPEAIEVSDRDAAAIFTWAASLIDWDPSAPQLLIERLGCDASLNAPDRK